MDPNIDTQELDPNLTNGGPQLDGQPQGEGGELDFKALFEQSEAEKRRMAEELTRTHQQQQQLGMQQVDQLWQQAEGAAWQNAEQMDPDRAKAYMANFYRERDNFVKTQASNALRSIGVKAWKDELRKNYQLSDEDMQMLGSDPEMMETHAMHIKRTREEIEKVKRENGITNAANRGQERLKTGAGVPFSGTRSSSGGPEASSYKKGSRQHLLALIDQGVI